MTQLKDNMNNIEKIRQEIERLKNIAENDNASEYLRGQARICRIILDFIDSLPEEKPSEDLEEAAEKFSFISEGVDSSGEPYKDYDSGKLEGFITGAEWQKEQMMKDAVEGEIGYWNQRGLSIQLDKSLERLGYDMDTKVKIIIIKDND